MLGLNVCLLAFVVVVVVVVVVVADGVVVIAPQTAQPMTAFMRRQSYSIVTIHFSERHTLSGGFV